MRNFLLSFFVFAGISANAQSVITEKGYYYSPSGFVCINGDIYTADNKALVRSCYPSLRDRGKDGFGQVVIVPSGTEVIPSHMIYHTDGKLINSGNNTSYCVTIPSSVKYIATDAFLTPYIKFFSEENKIPNESNSSRERGDVNEDGVVNSADVVKVVDIIMSDE